MNSQGASFILSNLPILIGAVLFLFLLKTNPLSHRYVISHEKQAGSGDYDLKQVNELDNFLIVNGLRKEKINKSKFIWFDKLNTFVDKGSPPKSITLITKNEIKAELCKSAYSSSPTFGLLIPYLLDSRLSGVEV